MSSSGQSAIVPAYHSPSHSTCEDEEGWEEAAVEAAAAADLHVIAASDLGGGLGGCVNEAVRRQLTRVLALPRLLLTRLPRLLR